MRHSTKKINKTQAARIALIKKITPLVKKHVENFGAPDSVTVGWPAYDEKELLSAMGALLDLRLSQGPYVREFERRCAAYVGAPDAVAVNSGSSANLLVYTWLIQSGAAEPGDEVLVPATTFSTVASPIIQVGLIPVYVDVEMNSWNIDPREIEKAITPKTRAIMAVHTLGNPANMPEIMRIARKHKLIVIEDCCEAHGARIGKKIVGSFGDISTLSFFVAHNITTGEGGMIFTRTKEQRAIIASLREFGRLPPEALSKRVFNDPVLGAYDARYIFTTIGYNVRMTDIAGALGVEQIKKLDRLNARRLKVVHKYLDILKKYDAFIQPPEIRSGTFHSFYGFGFAVRPHAPFKRQELVDFLEARGIETRAVFAGCIPDQPGFRLAPGRSYGKLPVARSIRDNGMFIGCHPALTARHIQIVRTAFADFFASIKK